MPIIRKIKNPYLRSAAEWLVLLGGAALLFFVMRGFIFRTARVDGHSMAPTLEHGDFIFLNRLVYVVSSPQVGDIVAFPFAENRNDVFIKRVIALPGDEVNFWDGFFYVNGVPLDDEFSLEPTISFGNVEFPIIVEEGRYFVLGDNRNGSQDSRFYSVGTICRREIIGRAAVRVWPLGRAGRVR
jgi:signal peptidase I